MVMLSFYSRAYTRFQMRNNWLFYVALVGSIISLIALCTT